MLVIRWEDGLDFVFPFNNSIEAAVDIIMKYFSEVLKLQILGIGRFRADHQNSFSFHFTNGPQHDNNLLRRLHTQHFLKVKLQQIHLIQFKATTSIIYNQSFKMICINQKKNLKLLQTFNNDPYSDITIKTAHSQLNLVLGYLSIDSEYFDRVAPDTREVDIGHLPESATIKVLRSLYGDQLQACNIEELHQLYIVIEFLEINEYKQNIQQYIIDHPKLMDSLQLLQFCFKHDILTNQIIKHHFNQKLSVLSSSKNYLQLNKISKLTLNELLLRYSQEMGPSADQTINSILQNYFGRNDLKASQYFTQPNLEPLQVIWEKFHHSINYMMSTQERVRQSQIFQNRNNEDTLKSTRIGVGTSKKIGGGYPSPMNSTVSIQLKIKDEKIANLERESALQDEIIASLKNQISNARREQSKKNIMLMESDDEECVLEQVKKFKKQKEEQTLSGEYDISMIEPAFDKARKLVNEQNREVKTMNKVNSRNKKIFN